MKCSLYHRICIFSLKNHRYFHNKHNLNLQKTRGRFPFFTHSIHFPKMLFFFWKYWSLLLSLNISFHRLTLNQNSVKQLPHIINYQTGQAFSTLNTLIHHFQGCVLVLVTWNKAFSVDGKHLKWVKQETSCTTLLHYGIMSSLILTSNHRQFYIQIIHSNIITNYHDIRIQSVSFN